MSSFSKNSSSKNIIEPSTNNFPLLGLIKNPPIGLFAGKLIGPLDKIGKLGFLTLSVAPYGYTNLRPPFSSLFYKSSFVSLYLLVYLPCFYSFSFGLPSATLNKNFSYSLQIIKIILEVHKSKNYYKFD